MKKVINQTSPVELRSLLIESARAVVDGRITVQQANAVSSLSSEIHKSLKMEYVGQMIDNGQYEIQGGKLIDVLEVK